MHPTKAIRARCQKDVLLSLSTSYAPFAGLLLSGNGNVSRCCPSHARRPRQGTEVCPRGAKPTCSHSLLSGSGTDRPAEGRTERPVVLLHRAGVPAQELVRRAIEEERHG